MSFEQDNDMFNLANLIQFDLQFANLSLHFRLSFYVHTLTGRRPFAIEAGMKPVVFRACRVRPYPHVITPGIVDMNFVRKHGHLSR